MSVEHQRFAAAYPLERGDDHRGLAARPAAVLWMDRRITGVLPELSGFGPKLIDGVGAEAAQRRGYVGDDALVIALPTRYTDQVLQEADALIFPRVDRGEHAGL